MWHACTQVEKKEKTLGAFMYASFTQEKRKKKLQSHTIFKVFFKYEYTYSNNGYSKKSEGFAMNMNI